MKESASLRKTASRPVHSYLSARGTGRWASNRGALTGLSFGCTRVSSACRTVSLISLMSSLSCWRATNIRQQLSSKRLICSHHDFAGVPADLENIYRRMAATNAPILKIAVQADDAIDCLPVFNLIERARREGRELIAIAMGQAGVMTRILGPSRGSFLTYGSLDEDSATAPGQVTARELREVYRIDSIDRETEIMGVIGRPVAHSISPHIHNAAFAQANINAVFIPFEVHDVDSFMRRMVRTSSREIEWNLRGLAVTAPHKSSVMKHLDWIEPAAKEIGAVNTIVVPGRRAARL